MIEATIFIPVADNDGQVFPATHHREFEAKLLGLFGGLSQSSETVRGAWLDGERVYQDHLILYLVALPSITAGGLLGEAVSFAKDHYQQEAIYVRYLGLAEII